MRRLLARLSLASIPLAVFLAACSLSPAPSSDTAPTAPANATLGSDEWYTWVDQSLAISDGSGHGPDHGSDEWNQAVQRKLGQEAPQSQPGSPEWQQSVDALLRTRMPKTGGR